MNNLSQTNKQMNIVRGSFRKSLVARMISKVGAWNQRRVAIQELSAMPDSLLRDLGIARYQIEDAVNQSGSFHQLSQASAKIEAVIPLHKDAA